MNKIQVLKHKACSKPSLEEFLVCDDRVKLLARAQIIVADNKEVLNVDLFSLDQGKVQLAGRYFAEKETYSYKAYAVRKKMWGKICIDNFARKLLDLDVMQGGNFYYRERERWKYAGKADEKTVWGYLGQSIGHWENEINSTYYYRRLDRKQDRISRMMEAEIPSVPEGFEPWLHDTVFSREYVFMEKTGKMVRHTCSACKGKWIRKKAAGIGYTICPHCGKKVLGTWQKKTSAKSEKIYLLQKCNGVSGKWVERMFECSADWTLKNGKTVFIDEQIRVIIPNKQIWGKCYYETFMDRDGNRQFWDKNNHSRRMSRGLLYPDTAEVRQCWPDCLKHFGMELLAEKRKINVNRMIVNSNSRIWLEYLIKGKFYRLAAEIIDDGWYSTPKQINAEGKNAMECLRLTNDRIMRLRAMDGGMTVLNWLQAEQAAGRKLSQENLLWLDDHGVSISQSDTKEMYEFFKSPEQFTNYLRKQSVLQSKPPLQIIQTYCDYIRMARQQRLNIAHEIFWKPKDLYAAHDECVRQGQKKEMQKRAKEIRKHFPTVEMILKDIREKYTFSDGTFSIVVPEDILDILHEGRSLGHCIDTSDRYFDRIQNRTSFLVFLRRTQAENIPYYTLEIEPGGTIRQQRTTGNEQKKEDAKEYMPFLRQWQRVVRERISEEDRKLAEKSKSIRLEEYKELRKQKEKVWHGKLAGKLLADVLEGDLMESI